jgi:hypothetical protein
MSHKTQNRDVLDFIEISFTGQRDSIVGSKGSDDGV